MYRMHRITDEKKRLGGPGLAPGFIVEQPPSWSRWNSMTAFHGAGIPIQQ
jgi:hypothetical protein